MSLSGWSRLLTMLAFLGALVAPRAAFAAFFPICETRDAMSIDMGDMGRDPPSASARARDDHDACEASKSALVQHNDDLGDTSVAAMCDVRGASVVAPPRIVPINDARIEAARSCLALKNAPSCEPSSDDPPAAPNTAAIEPMVLAASIEPPPADFVEISFVVLYDSAHEGFAPTLERPPRS